MDSLWHRYARECINDFAHTWEDTPNFPFHPHNSKEIPQQKLLVKFLGAHLPGGFVVRLRRRCDAVFLMPIYQEIIKADSGRVFSGHIWKELPGKNP